MKLLDLMGETGHEQVVHCSDPATGLRAIIAVHSTWLGPALGGVRFRPYADEAEALTDVLRLAEGMTYKAAVAGLDLGGGKAVIIGDPATDRTPELIVSYAKFVDGLGGRYLTAEDVGTTQADMDLIATVTPHVTGTSSQRGGSGDPSPATALGVFCAMEATAEHLWGGGLDGRRVTVIGTGKVGSALVGHLAAAGAVVSAADVDPVALARARNLGAVEVDVADVYTRPCDILAPCALGGGLDPATIAALDCRAVVGAANNQLADRSCAELLADREVCYVPDYLANAGGIVNIAEELTESGYDRTRAFEAVRTIGARVRDVLTAADRDATTPLAAAEALAARRLRATV